MADQQHRLPRGLRHLPGLCRGAGLAGGHRPPAGQRLQLLLGPADDLHPRRAARGPAPLPAVRHDHRDGCRATNPAGHRAHLAARSDATGRRRADGTALRQQRPAARAPLPAPLVQRLATARNRPDALPRPDGHALLRRVQQRHGRGDGDVCG